MTECIDDSEEIFHSILDRIVPEFEITPIKKKVPVTMIDKKSWPIHLLNINRYPLDQYHIRENKKVKNSRDVLRVNDLAVDKF